MAQNTLLHAIKVSEAFQKLADAAAAEIESEADSVAIGVPATKLSTSAACKDVIDEFYRRYISIVQDITFQGRPEAANSDTYGQAVFALQRGDFSLKGLWSTILIPIAGFGASLKLKVQDAEGSEDVEAKRDCIFVVPGSCKLQSSGSGKIVCILLGFKNKESTENIL